MNDFILYYYLNPEKTHPYYVGQGRRNRLRTKTDRKKVPVPPPDRRVIVAEGLTQEESWELEKLHIKLWGRQLDGGVLIKQATGGPGRPGAPPTSGHTGHSHSEETKQHLSQKLSGPGNPRFGTTHTEESKELMRQKALERNKTGINNPNHKSYELTSPTGEVCVIIGGLRKFCQENDLSYGTLRKTLDEGWPPSRKGRNKGWKIRKV